MQRESLRTHLPAALLMLAAIIWGAGFMAVQISLDSDLSEGLIVLCRFAVASLALIAVAYKRIFPVKKQDLLCGLPAGFLLFLGFYSQTLGMKLTTPSNNGFFTATNVIMVPFIAWALHKKRPPAKLFFCSLMALAGFFILAWSPNVGLSANAGDLLTLLCAFFFACHIASLGILSPMADTLRLTFWQMTFACGFSLIAFLLFELPSLSYANWRAGLPAVIFLGLFSTCVCFFIQTWAQSKTSSGKAAVILSCESLWCMVFSVMMGYEPLSARMVVGGLVIMSAVCLLETDFAPLAEPSSCKG